jgi:predicted alpha/beta hydrolase family esterase
MENIFIIHGYNGIPKIFTWLKNQLELKGYKVYMPEFPPREGVVYKVWENLINKYNDEFNNDTVVIAHSIGNELIIKYLSKNNIKIKLYIGLAGFAEYFENKGKDDLNRAIKEFLVSEDQINIFNKLVDAKYCIYSDNDHIVPFEVLEKFPKLINSKSIMIKGIGHMGSKSGLETIPIVLDIIEENNK